MLNRSARSTTTAESRLTSTAGSWPLYHDLKSFAALGAATVALAEKLKQTRARGDTPVTEPTQTPSSRLNAALAAQRL